MSDPFSIHDRTYIVTGGLGQLGRQFTLSLLDRGARVAVWDAKADAPNAAARFGAQAKSDRLLLAQVDVTDRSSIEAVLAQLTITWGTPHGIVNNAGLDSPPNASAAENGPFESYPADSWDRVMDVNAKGVFLCCQVVGGAMATAGRGSIVNIASIYGMISPDQRIYEYRAANGDPFFKPVAYGASKAALFNLTRYLSTYWAGRNVRVNTLTLGGVYNEQDPSFLEGYCARVPLARMAREDEYNGAIQFLLSDASSYMTGSNMVIDGGWTAW